MRTLKMLAVFAFVVPAAAVLGQSVEKKEGKKQEEKKSLVEKYVPESAEIFRETVFRDFGKMKGKEMADLSCRFLSFAEKALWCSEEGDALAALVKKMGKPDDKEADRVRKESKETLLRQLKEQADFVGLLGFIISPPRSTTYRVRWVNSEWLVEPDLIISPEKKEKKK